MIPTTKTLFRGIRGGICSALITGFTAFSASHALAEFTTPPVANAGPDQTVTASASGTAPITLDGRDSYDVDPGDVLDFLWQNSVTAYGEQPTVNVGVGTHVFTLTVTDLAGNIATDTVTITVNPPAGGCPTITTPAQDLTVECDGLGDNGPLLAWLNNHGGAVATAPSGTIVWTNNYNPANFVYEETNGDCAEGHVTVIFTATVNDCSVSTSATFTVVDTTPPTLAWVVGGNAVNDSGTYCFSSKDLPLVVTVTPSDICGGATLTKHVALTIAGSATTTFTGNSFTITSAQVNTSIKLIAKATDDCGNVSPEEWVIVNIVAPGKADCFAKGNEGLGNGVDPNTPGHIHNGGNDDPAYHPGNPGARNKHL